MAAYSNALSDRVTFIAGASILTTTSYCRVGYISASMTCCLASASSDDAIGIIDTTLSAGSDAVTVIMHGLARGVMQSATACAIGDWLVADTMGSLDVALTNTTANQQIIGRALEVPATGGSVQIYVNIHAGGTIV